MAAIHSEKRSKGIYYRLMVTVEGAKKRIGIGYNCDKKALRKLEVLASKLESLVDVGETPDAKLLAEVGELSEELIEKLFEHGLISKPAPRLKEFLTSYITSRTDITDYTRTKLTNSSKRFIKFFGDVRLGSITPGDASVPRR